MSFLYGITNKECIELAKTYHSSINPTVDISDCSIYLKDKGQNRFLQIHVFDQPTRDQIFNNLLTIEKRYYSFNEGNVIHDYNCYISYYSNEYDAPGSLLDISQNAIDKTISILSKKEKLYNELNLKARNQDFKNFIGSYLDFFSEGEIEKIKVMKDGHLYFKNPILELIIKKLIEVTYTLTVVRNKQDFINALKSKYTFNQINFTYYSAEKEFDSLLELYHFVYCIQQQPELLISQFSPFVSFEKVKLTFETKGFFFTQTTLTITELESYFGSDNEFKNKIQQIEEDIEDKILNELLIKRKSIDNEFQIKKKEIIFELDENEDGSIDIVTEEDFTTILNEKQAEIIKIDRGYIQKFIKVSSYLKTKRNNIQILFKSLEESSNEIEFENKEAFLKGQIYSYQLLLFHSISMITALVKDNLIVFYEVYEAFDKLSIFNSNWENEVSQKLSTINRKLDDLINAVNKVEYAISEGLENLSYTTQNSFEKFQSSINEQLANIDSSVRVNNLLSAIQIYQLYKVNKHAKRIQ